MRNVDGDFPMMRGINLWNEHMTPTLMWLYNHLNSSKICLELRFSQPGVLVIVTPKRFSPIVSRQVYLLLRAGNLLWTNSFPALLFTEDMDEWDEMNVFIVGEGLFPAE